MNSDDHSRFLRLGAKVGVWFLILGILFLLRAFFLLVFLTFVFGFVQARGVDLLAKYIRPRAARSWIVGLVLLGVLSGVGLFLAPNLKAQTELFARHFDSYALALDTEIYALADEYPIFDDALADLTRAPIPNPPGTGETTEEAQVKASPTLMIMQQILGLQDIEDHRPPSIGSLLSKLVMVSGKVVGIASAFLLSLLFSFLIVLDLPGLIGAVRSLQNTKLRFAYHEVAPSIYDFSRVLGQALEAQFFVAVINSGLTALGLWLLGLGHYLAFLATIVFLFSFVPVAGVFISSVPICLVALQNSGVHIMLLAVALIVVVHFTEAYILNPRIYGKHLRINPVIVLVILTISGKLFQFWGLVLGVPLCTWFFTHAIRPSPSTNNPSA